MEESMILQKIFKHAMKWSLVLLTKYKKCSITNASNLDPCSCNVHLNISTDAQRA